MPLESNFQDNSHMKKGFSRSEAFANQLEIVH